MKGPKSYTAEDVVEINCHGGIIVTKKVLDICLKNGARIAAPGEFTKRAFLNGRIDLSQAEAVSDLINAKNDYAASTSVAQLKGHLKDKIGEIRERIIHDVAFIEAALDDPEHYDVDEYNETLGLNVKNVIERIKKLYDSAENGRIIKEGINTVIVGKPNAGKSSFLNALIGEDRAIVTEIEGTTRDVLCEEVNIDGIILNLVDTAGIRQTSDIVEQIGVDKAKDYVDKSDLVIYIVDSSIALDDNDVDIINMIKDKNVIVLMNKADLDTVTSREDMEKYIPNALDIIEISAKNIIGIEEFNKELMKGSNYYYDYIRG
jgi:tRNA modification GTPase